MTGLGKRLLGGSRAGRATNRRARSSFRRQAGARDGFDYSRLLVTTDGSENADTATRHAAAVADKRAQ